MTKESPTPRDVVEYIDEIFKSQTGAGMQSLKKVGKKGNWKCLCPFHKEKTPSFTFHTIKRLYYCFGCHRAGKIINLEQHLKEFMMELQSHHKMIFRGMWAMRHHKGLVQHQGGVVYPREELKKMIKELRRIKEA